MNEIVNHVRTLNSAVRTLMVLVACSVLGYGGYVGYDQYIKPGQEARQAIAELEQMRVDFRAQTVELQQAQQDLRQSQQELQVARELNERLETSMKLLKVDRRVANITVLEKGLDEEGQPFMEVSFREVDADGKEIGYEKNYRLRGEKFYVDGWIAKFEDRYVEEADELRAASLFVFKSIYGDAETPRDAQRLDVESAGAPGVYADPQKREFEEQIWNDFWAVCNDPARQRDLGIRASQGQASYVQPRVGKTYQISIRASGGMSLSPVEEP